MFAPDLAQVLAALFAVTPEQLAAHVQAKQAAARKRIAANNARYDAAFSKLTDEQAVVLDALICQGHTQDGKIWVSRSTGQIAILLVKKQCWNPQKMRVGTKLVMLYPDGSRSETFEKSISIRRDF